MKAVWDREMVWVGQLQLMAMPRANLAGPNLEISQCDLSMFQKQLFFSGDDVAENMSST
jgi:hypothetical protein